MSKKIDALVAARKLISDYDTKRARYKELTERREFTLEARMLDDTCSSLQYSALDVLRSLVNALDHLE